MSVYKRPGQSEYSYDFHYRRQRFSGGTGCTSRREAEKVELEQRERVRARFIYAGKPLTVEAGFTLYWDQVGAHHTNRSDTLRSLEWLQRNLGKDTLIADISDAEVAKLVARRRGEFVPSQRKPGRKYGTVEIRKRVANATVNRTVTIPLRQVMLRALKVWKQRVQDIAWKTHFLEETQERVREATKEEESLLTRSMRDDYEPALRFAVMTGCRREEIVGLTWARVDFFNREFTVLGKRNKSRTVPMTDATFALLWSLKDHHPVSVFTYVSRRPGPLQTKGVRYPMTTEGFKTEWWRTRARTTVENFKFHDTRHTAASRVVRATGNLKMAQKLLGHSDIATTARYAHVHMDDLRSGLEKAEGAAIVRKAGGRSE